MNIETIIPDEEIMIVTQLIGLCEAQRTIYDNLGSHIAEELQNAYFFHKRELETLIKYQNSKNNDK